MTIEERFLNLVKKTDSCWQWQGYLYHGYGKFKVDKKLVAAHRLAYELYVGKIPVDHQIDHTCHNVDSTCVDGDTCLHRSCVNPAHLEPVTGAENKRRSPQWMGNKTVCKRGHEFMQGSRQRRCYSCERMTPQQRRQYDAAKN